MFRKYVCVGEIKHYVSYAEAISSQSISNFERNLHKYTLITSY